MLASVSIFYFEQYDEEIQFWFFGGDVILFLDLMGINRPSYRCTDSRESFNTTD